MKLYSAKNAREEKLQHIGNHARNIGLFVDSSCTTLADGCLFIAANEYCEIDTETICFSFVLDDIDNVRINGMGLKDVLVYPGTDVQALLTQTLIAKGFVHTWVKPV